MRVAMGDGVPVADPLQNTDFEDLVQRQLREWHVPGVAVAVLDGPKTWHRGFGFSKLPHRPVLPTTNFFAGSTSKAMTAAALSQLVSDNIRYPNIQWRTPVSHIIRDDFVLEDEWTTNRVTIEDILSHRTGMPHHDRAHGRKPDKSTPHDLPRPVVREMVRQMRYLPLTADIRTTYQYCNLMFVAASHLIESVTGVWLGKTLKDEIWHPLGMSDTHFATEDALKGSGDLAQGYKYNESKERFEEVPWMDLDSSTGAGAVVSNVIDYAKWARAVMERTDKLTGVDWDALTTPRALMASAEPFTGHQAYALGWRTGVYKGHRFWEHTGGMNCFGTELIIFPDIQYAFVAFGNTAGSSNFVEKTLAFYLINEKLHTPESERFDWDASNREIIADGKKLAEDPVGRFHLNPPADKLPLQLPLSAYAGSYHHPGYQTIEIYVDKEQEILRADRIETSWPEHMTFEHVSGNDFVIRSEWEGDFSAFFPEVYAAAFQVRSDGVVGSIGITWEPRMGTDKIWLARIEK